MFENEHLQIVHIEVVGSRVVQALHNLAGDYHWRYLGGCVHPIALCASGSVHSVGTLFDGDLVQAVAQREWLRRMGTRCRIIFRGVGRAEG